MEDAHIANLDIGDGVSIFGVFDGHGGKYYQFYKSSSFKQIYRERSGSICGQAFHKGAKETR